MEAVEAGSKEAKSSGKSSGPALVKQPHGGALYSGGVPGHVGAGGRPRSELRALARKIYALSMDKVQEALANNPNASLGELSRVAEVAGKFGMGDAQPEAVSNAEVVSRVLQYLKEEKGIDAGELADYEAWERDRF